jgi:transcriptional regulator PpsR
MIGGSLPVELTPDSAAALRSLSMSVRSGQLAEDARIRIAETQQEFILSTSLFRQAASAFYLIRFTPAIMDAALPQAASAGSKLLKFVRNAPDGFVMTDRDGLIVTANTAFLQMAQVMTEDLVRGQSIDRWLGRSDVDMRVVIANLRQHGAVHLFASVLRGELGASTDVEISANSLVEGEALGFGFAIRNVGRRLATPGAEQRFPPRSPEHLKDLIGRVPLKDIVRDTTDVIERLSIEAALELTGDNRASAAEMLGLSRQSLYVKLRRFGLSDSSRDDADDS